MASVIALTSLATAIPVGATSYEMKTLPKSMTIKVNGVKRITLKSKVSVYDYNYGKYITKYKNVKATFKSNKPSVASVSSDGIVRAHKIGKAKLSVKYNGEKKYINVKVSKKKTIYIAHRGAEDIAPECTLVALQKAVDVGYSQMECDVWVDKSGDFIVFHDSNMERLTGKNMHIEQLTETLRKKLPIIGGNNTSYYPTQYIPKAKDVLKLVNKNPGIILTMHLKTTLDANQAAKLAKMIKKYGVEDRIVLLSEKVNNLHLYKGYGFKRAYLCRWRNEAHLLRVVDWAIKNKINIIYYKYYSDFLPPSSFILKAHENNIAINCFSLNKVSQYEQMTELGINGVICNKILFTYDPLLNPAFVPPTEPPTEAPTKAPTEPPTEAPTETPTASSTVPVTEPVQEPSETATA